jgi:hypothetical protein
MGTVLELGHLPLAVNGFVGDAWQQSLERWSQTSDHRVLGRIGLDAEQWIVGFLSTIAGIVTDGGIFLVAEYRPTVLSESKINLER